MIIKRFAYRQILLLIFIFRSDLNIDIDSNVQVSPEQSVMHKNGFAKLATMCCVNLCIKKKTIKENYQRKSFLFFQLRFKIKKSRYLMKFGTSMKKMFQCYPLKQEWFVTRLLVREGQNPHFQCC